MEKKTGIILAIVLIAVVCVAAYAVFGMNGGDDGDDSTADRELRSAAAEAFKENVGESAKIDKMEFNYGSSNNVATVVITYTDNGTTGKVSATFYSYKHGDHSHWSMVGDFNDVVTDTGDDLEELAREKFEEEIGGETALKSVNMKYSEGKTIAVVTIEYMVGDESRTACATFQSHTHGDHVHWMETKAFAVVETGADDGPDSEDDKEVVDAAKAKFAEQLPDAALKNMVRSYVSEDGTVAVATATYTLPGDDALLTAYATFQGHSHGDHMHWVAISDFKNL